ncbi:hypothetical protein THASP1DRAFT_30680 [Thamnocephalis sphaerospora]|uniref:Uncharacterized protein n=1 Tax=Thamnocephalis sphaerospora TaxID=78915 RepID=A0A4P9XQF0_9FUNG|nr:hypothetical protein THASP1DRAFT_30680 [Thamnocephalis sphaerospora]|eukprot:RKP07510.1 hypothetical protein THASP1DRAFT_30680 [Thamnocephalis sphaerospora]
MQQQSRRLRRQGLPKLLLPEAGAAKRLPTIRRKRIRPRTSANEAQNATAATAENSSAKLPSDDGTAQRGGLLGGAFRRIFNRFDDRQVMAQTEIHLASQLAGQPSTTTPSIATIRRIAKAKLNDSYITMVRPTRTRRTPPPGACIFCIAGIDSECGTTALRRDPAARSEAERILRTMLRQPSQRLVGVNTTKSAHNRNDKLKLVGSQPANAKTRLDSPSQSLLDAASQNYVRRLSNVPSGESEKAVDTDSDTDESDVELVAIPPPPPPRPPSMHTVSTQAPLEKKASLESFASTEDNEAAAVDTAHVSLTTMRVRRRRSSAWTAFFDGHRERRGSATTIMMVGDDKVPDGQESRLQMRRGSVAVLAISRTPTDTSIAMARRGSAVTLHGPRVLIADPTMTSPIEQQQLGLTRPGYPAIHARLARHQGLAGIHAVGERSASHRVLASIQRISGVSMRPSLTHDAVERSSAPPSMRHHWATSHIVPTVTFDASTGRTIAPTDAGDQQDSGDGGDVARRDGFSLPGGRLHVDTRLQSTLAKVEHDSPDNVSHMDSACSTTMARDLADDSAAAS